MIWNKFSSHISMYETSVIYLWAFGTDMVLLWILKKRKTWP